MKLELKYPIDCPVDEFWALYFDPAFTEDLHRKALGSTSWEIVSQTGDVRTGLERSMRYGQSPDMPGPVKKLFGSEVITTETGTFDPETGIWSFELMPGTMANKTQMAGSIALVGDGPKCTQVFCLEARVKILGMGPIVEGFIQRQARDSQDKAAAFMNEHFRNSKQ